MQSILKLEQNVQEKRNTLRAERLDMSFGELMNLYQDENLIITPEYQRVFRWDKFQQTRFIESILLGLPIPPIFVAEDNNGKWELVDGLQRLSTIFSFFGELKKVPENKNNLILEKGELLETLEGIGKDNLPIKLNLWIKRSVCRVEILKQDSEFDMRYELFNRLNTSASPLSDQEIRNCIFRGDGNKLNAILVEIVKNSEFGKLIKPTDKQAETMFCEELVLSFFTLKNYGTEFRINRQNHLSEFMKKVTKDDISFDFEEEKNNFYKLINYLNSNFDYKIFRSNKGVFAVHLYDAVTLSLNKYFDVYKDNQDLFKKKIEKLKISEEYKDITSQSYSRTRTQKQIELAFKIFSNHDDR